MNFCHSSKKAFLPPHFNDVYRMHIHDVCISILMSIINTVRVLQTFRVIRGMSEKKENIQLIETSKKVTKKTFLFKRKYYKTFNIYYNNFLCIRPRIDRNGPT